MTEEQTYVEDSLINAATGLGTLSDPQTHNVWVRRGYNERLLTTLYVENWIARRIITVPADDATKHGRRITTPSMSPEDIRRFEQAEKHMHVKQASRSALYWSRLYGGGGIFVAVGGGDNSEPLSYAGLRSARINYVPLNRNEILPDNSTLIEDNADPNFGLPEKYILSRAHKDTARIHHSRFIRFEGIEAPRRVRRENSGWSLSVLDSELISNIEACASMICALGAAVNKANIDIISVPGLFNKLINKQTASQVRMRFSEAKSIQKQTGVMLMDADETYARLESKGTSSSASLLSDFLQLPAAASGIPVTRLLGISPGGMNATGDSDTDNYMSLIEDIQGGELSSMYNASDPIVAASIGTTLPADWSFEFRSIYPANKKEASEIESRRVQDIILTATSGVVPPSTALRQLADDGAFSAVDANLLDQITELENLGGDDDDSDNDDVALISSEPATMSEEDEPQKKAMNGAQVSSLLEIAQLVKSGSIDFSQASAVLSTAFPSMSTAAISSIVNVEVVEAKSSEEEIKNKKE